MSLKKHELPVLVRGSVFRALIGKAFPILGAFIAFTLFNAVDTWYVAQLGEEYLIAISYTFPVVNAIFSICYGITTGAVAVNSNLAGQGRKGEISQFTGDSLYLSLLVAFFFSVIGILTINPIFAILGASEESIQHLTGYMTIWYLGMPALIVPMLLNGTLRSTGNSLLPSTVMIIAAVINMVLDPIFIFGIPGLIDGFGMEGAAVATILARMCGLSASVYFVKYKYQLLHFRGWDWEPILKSWARLLRIGLPSILMQLAYPLLAFYMVHICAKFGENVVGGVGVGLRIHAFILMPINAIAISMMSFAGQNWGANRKDRINTGVNQFILFSLFWIIFCVLFLVLVGRYLTTLFTENLEIQSVAFDFLICATWSGIGFGIINNVNSLLKGISRPLLFTVTTLIHVFVFAIPSLFILSRLGEVEYIFIGMVIVDSLGGLFAYLVYRKWVMGGIFSKAS